MENPILARVIHPYNPLNNDELKLAKDEIITVAQKDDGGWWEGTLNGKSGWFPSNYVVEITESDVHEIVSNGSQVASLTSLDSLNSQRVEYKRMVLQDLIESENAYILDFQSIWDNYLVPLRGADVLKSSEYEALIGNTPEILQLHSNLLLQLRKEQAKPHRDQRIGKVFLECALKLETVHKSYCSNHPKAMQTKDKHKEALNDYMESKGAQQPGILVLILALSQPLRRLEKYPGMLTELERHIEENHKDRGDLQRSIEYYKLIDKNCSVARKQKEMELEVLNGGIKNYEGTDVAQLGEIIYMNLVQVGPELQSRYFVLFANTLLILSHVPESNSLVYEGKIPVSGILLTNVPDTDDVVNAFEIAGPMLEPIMVKCTSKEVKEIWLDHLTRILKLSRLPTTISAVQQSFGHLTPPVQAWNMARLRPAPTYNPFLSERLKSTPKTKASGRGDKLSSSSSSSQLQSLMNGGHTGSHLVTNEDDLLVLSIVDGFCSKTRQISASLVGPPVIPSPKPSQSASPEKLPRTLTELVVLLGEEVRSLKGAMVKISGQLEEEQRSRKALQTAIAASLKHCTCGQYKS